MNLKTKKFYGINWALEDFVLEKDTALPNGTVLSARERYFTWTEAMTLQRMSVFPEGYRLPTGGEFRSLVKNVGSLIIRKRLNFATYYGCRGRSSYNENWVEGAGEKGYYWSSSPEKEHNAVALEVCVFNYCGVYAWTRTSYRDYGYSIRLVYDPK
ncbi:hypothetical protein IKE99_02215 [Candidatus Saccharibacteria bacterium]|nr:hypothetical protein [Candidatus Saccharibacteria bacterium]